MPTLPLARSGRKLNVRNAPVDFSYYPTYQGTRRAGLHTKVYTTDAWAVIKAAIRQASPALDRATAAAFADQAQEFYRAATNAQTPHSRPLLLYYAFLNLAKALCLHTGRRNVLGKALHGLTESNAQQADITAATVTAFPTNLADPGNPQRNVFHEFLIASTGRGLSGPVTYQVRDLLAASLVGHRLWTEAADSEDRFLKLIDIDIMQSSVSKTLWLRAHISRSSLKKHGFSQATVTNDGFGPGWRPVRLRSGGRASVAVWEQTQQVQYAHRPSDSLAALVATFRDSCYRSLTTFEPFRNYYVYVPPAGFVKPNQLAARYILLFFLGSVTRYRPANFATFLDGEYGPFLAEFIASEPSQGLFEMACLFVKREVVTVGLS